MRRKYHTLLLSTVITLVVIFASSLLIWKAASHLLSANEISADENETESGANTVVIAGDQEDASDADSNEAYEPEPSLHEEEDSKPSPPTAKESAEKILADMTQEEKIFQMFIVTQEQLTGVSPVTKSGETTRAAIENCPVGGIIYFAPNLISREQCMSMIEDIQSYSRLGLFIAVDEEGGSVARLGSNPAMGTTAFAAMGTIGNTGDTSEAYNVGYTIGTDIAGLGFNLDFAPVADVNSNPANTVIDTRAFSSDPEIAAEMVAACVEGFTDSGILCTLKHFPGHGDTDTDSHNEQASTSKTLEQLHECELLPFEAGIQAGAPLVMVGHISAPDVTEEDVPAALSHELVTDLLRGQMGYSGLIVTDSMSMAAITGRYSSGEAAVKAIQAGIDIILMPDDLSEAVSSIKTALSIGELTEERIDESVLRILKVKIESGIIATGSE